MESAKTHFETNQEDRIPIGQKLAYSAGSLVNNLQAAAIGAMLPILNLGFGMDPVLVGLIGSIPRAVDSVTDPVMGYISDNTRTRWGRRRPYLLVGALVAGLAYATLWQVPIGSSQDMYFWVFLVGFVVYFLSYSMFAAPLIALGYELTPDYHERTRLHAFANTVGQLAWLIAPWFYAIMSYELLFDNVAQGAQSLGLIVGLVICFLGILPAVYCRERVLPEINGNDISLASLPLRIARHTLSFFQNVVTTLRCRPFVKLCAATFLVFNGYQVGISFTLYALIYYVYDSDERAAGILYGCYGTLTAACSLLLIPLAGWLATKIGKRETFLLAMTVSLVGYALKWVGYNPNYPYLLLIACPFIACGIGSLFTLMSSMVADVCDYDELRTNRRREGMFGAIYWWMVKVGMALASLIAGALLESSGFDVELATQSERSLELIRLFDVSVPFATTLLAIGIVSTYQISEQEAHEIREQLETRRGKTGSPGSAETS